MTIALAGLTPATVKPCTQSRGTNTKLPAVAVQRFESWEAAQWRAVWRRSVRPSMHADVWADAIVSPEPDALSSSVAGADTDTLGEAGVADTHPVAGADSGPVARPDRDA